MHHILDRTLRLADELLTIEESSQPEPRREPVELREAIPLALPQRGQDTARVMDLLARVIRATPKTSSHRFFNQLFGGREITAAAAETIAGLLNTSMYTYKVAGLQVLIERIVTDRMAELAGYDGGEGLSMPGGSLANLTGLLLARNEALPEVRDHGLGERAARIYVSADGHYSIRKNAGILGLGRDHVCDVPTDDDGRMQVAALDDLLQADRQAGRLPICVVATAGTTVLGAFDPLREIAAVCRRNGVWMHVDGAYGASFLLHPRHRQRLDGVELSDSLTWNAHKMMGVPMPCSILLVRQRGLLNRHLNEEADYLFQRPDFELDPGTRSLQCGRRNDILKLWAAWQHLGDDGWAQRIDRQLTLAAYAAGVIERDPHLALTHVPTSLNVCFEVPGVSSRLICEELDRLGLAAVGYGRVRGREVIRLVTVNPDVTETDLERLLTDIKRVAEELP